MQSLAVPRVCYDFFDLNAITEQILRDLYRLISVLKSARVFSSRDKCKAKLSQSPVTTNKSKQRESMIVYSAVTIALA